MAMPVVWSPCAGRGIGATPPGSVIASVIEPRPKNVVTSKPGRATSGPTSP